MEFKIEKKQFVSVHYPGVVNSTDKMLETLGGEANINEVFNTPGQRLELHFRPGDCFSKTACANRHATTDLVLRIRRRRKKPEGDAASTGSEQVAYEYSGEIIGTIEKSYKFMNLADFQYLPMTKSPNANVYQPLLPSISFNKIEKPSWIKRDAELFLPPSLFSRIDSSSDYNYRDGPTKSGQGSRTQNPNVISVYRQRRPHFTQIVTNEDWWVPEAPIPQAMEKIQSKQKYLDELAALQELFKKRPIWSRMSIVMNLKRPLEFVKLFLPCVAYYILTGPWRRIWIRFGYDPKTNPEAKIYQVIDFRIKDQTLAKRLGISIKRSSTSYNLPNKMTKLSSMTPKIEKSELANLPQNPEDPEKDQRQKDAYYKFYPGLVPAYRQICYVYCDLEVDEIQQLIHANDGKEAECTDKDGWCLPHTTENIRKILIKHLSAMFHEKPGDDISSNAWYSSNCLKRDLSAPKKQPTNPALSTSLVQTVEPSAATDADIMEVDTFDLPDDDDLNSEEEEMFAEDDDEGSDNDDGAKRS